MSQSEVAKFLQVGTSRRSSSAWASNCVVVCKRDGAPKGCQDYRGLRMLLKPNSGVLGDIQSTSEGRRGAGCFTSI